MRQVRHLVTQGLYSRIRHPIYVFGSLAYFGSLLALRVLAGAFGAEYAAYRSKTWF